MTDHERLCEDLRELLAWFAKPPIKHDQFLPERFSEWLARLRSNGPDGVRVVPVEPTQAMKRALFLNLANANDERAVIKAVIAAGGEQ